MINISLKDIITIIPDILQYFVSGYIFILIFKSICSKKIGATIQLIYSCVISFLFISLINGLNAVWIKSALLNNLWVISILSVFLSAIISVIISKIFISKWFHKFLVNCFGISPRASAFDNVIDCKNGTNIKVYLKDKDFYIVGHLFSFEDNGNDSWYCIHKQQKYNFNNELLYSQEDNENAHLLFNIKEVDYMEIFNG